MTLEDAAEVRQSISRWIRRKFIWKQKQTNKTHNKEYLNLLPSLRTRMEIYTTSLMHQKTQTPTHPTFYQLAPQFPRYLLLILLISTYKGSPEWSIGTTESRKHAGCRRLCINRAYVGVASWTAGVGFAARVVCRSWRTLLTVSSWPLAGSTPPPRLRRWMGLLRQCFIIKIEALI
jgi:hypothetical protein